jgi:hypothetical protein
MKSRKTTRGLRDVFAGVGRYEMPALLPELCSDLVPDELVTYRSGRHTPEQSAGGVLSFFVDDWRFEAAWSYPNRFLNGLLHSGWGAVCEPDFSVWADCPRAEQIWAVYRARWCARFWQAHGLPVIPCLNWSTASSFRWAWDGIPVGVPVVAIECQTHGGNLQAFNHGLAAACERVQPKHLLIYGKAKIEVPSGVEAHWYKSSTARMRARLESSRWVGVAE